MSSPRSLLLRCADIVVTMDAGCREIAHGSVRIEGNRIVSVGGDMDHDPADETIDLSGYVLLPDLVNADHHMVQSLTRAVPATQDASLFDWLRALYPIWEGLPPRWSRLLPRPRWPS